MLSLVLGSEITDASVAAIASSFSKLELLDLSGYVLVLALAVLVTMSSVYHLLKDYC